MTNLDKNYSAAEKEKFWQDYWRQNKTYQFDQSQDRSQNFVIDTPPPTVSGVLHMGHIFSYTQADFIARFMRMQGKNVFYPMGFDDNGLPTERLVEKVKKIRGNQMERQEFIKICQGVVDEAEQEFEDLFNSIALSVDWSQKYQTISAQSQKLSQMSFVDLFNKDRAYRSASPVFFDIADSTALAQADLEDKEFDSFMNDLIFTVKETGQQVLIATTRPELLAACQAVFFHPNDERYQDLQNKTVITPLFNKEVKFLSDDAVKIDKGTGLVMCCTFGDEQDIRWWQKHQLNCDVIISKTGRIELQKVCNDQDLINLFKDDQGRELKVKNFRAKIIEILKEKNLLKTQTPIKHSVKCAERSGQPIEIITDDQWFIKILDQKEQLLQKAHQCNWHPNFMKERLIAWIEGLSWDWCISRQRFFGVPFPIWYSKRAGEEGKILVADISQLPCNPLEDLPAGYSKDEVEPEIAVMDTWATSSISPQLSSHGINDDLAIDADRHQKLFPADLRPQAHEIIRSWAFYTIVKAHLHDNQIPWKNLMISGWCLAEDKTKMSKSKGNVITPVGLIKEKGADAVRYWASTSQLGQDTAFSENVLKIGQKLVKKLFNAAKFAATNLNIIENIDPKNIEDDIKQGNIYCQIDLFAIKKLQDTIQNSTKHLQDYQYSKARASIEDYFWNIFCDNYLEIIKIRSYGLDANKYQDQNPSQDQIKQILKAQKSAILTINYVLDTILRLFAPILPHICEELHAKIYPNRQINSIHQMNTWPQTINQDLPSNLDQAGQNIIDIISYVRKFKTDQNLSMKSQIENLTINCDLTENLAEDLKNVCNSNKITTNKNSTNIAQIST